MAPDIPRTFPSLQFWNLLSWPGGQIYLKSLYIPPIYLTLSWGYTVFKAACVLRSWSTMSLRLSLTFPSWYVCITSLNLIEEHTSQAFSEFGIGWPQIQNVLLGQYGGIYLSLVGFPWTMFFSGGCLFCYFVAGFSLSKISSMNSCLKICHQRRRLLLVVFSP